MLPFARLQIEFYVEPRYPAGGMQEVRFLPLTVIFALLLIGILSACQAPQVTSNGDTAIRSVKNCVCYKCAEGQKMEPWQLTWEEPEKLRRQLSHCVCEADIDLQNVENPARYLVPGTIVK